MGEKQIRFVKSSDSEIKKMVANIVPESTKRSTKYAVNVFGGEESTGTDYQIARVYFT